MTRTIISILVLTAICAGGIVPARADDQAAVDQAKKAADTWLKLVDEGKFGRAGSKPPPSLRITSLRSDGNRW